MNSLDRRRPLGHSSPARPIRRVATTAVLVLLVCARVWAAGIDLETPGGLEALLKIEIPDVTGASRFKQPATQAPSSVSVITADQIKLYGYRTLADILQSAHGLHVSYDRTYSSLGFRGFTFGGIRDSNNRVLVLVDGHRINNSLTDGAFIGTDFILDVDLIERVEIIPGPGSALYGANALFGVINVVTRQGRGLGAELSAEAASFDTYKGRATYGHRFENEVEMLISGTLYDSQGQANLFFKENVTTNSNGIAHNGDYDNFKSAFGKVSFHDFSVEGAYISREKGLPTGLNNTVFDDPRMRALDERGYANLRYAHEWDDVVDVTAQIYYDRQHSTLDTVYPVARTNTILARQELEGDRWGAELQLTKKLFERHTITLGAEYRDDFHQEQRNFFVPALSGSTEIQGTTFNYGVYLAGDFAVLTNLHLNAGVRCDKYANLDLTANPRVALIYNPVGQSIFKAIYGTAFRAPNFFERNYGASDLGPETITSYELVYEQGFGEHFRATVSSFYNQMDDFIRQETNTFNYVNLGSIEAKGAEVAFKHTWHTLVSWISYTYQDIEDRDTGQVPPNSPRHLFKANLGAPIVKEKLFTGLEVQYVSARTTVRTLPNFAIERGQEAPDYTVVNFTLFSRNLIKGLEVSASIYNLLDKRYGDPSTPFHVQAVIPRDGRTFRVKLAYRF